MFVFSLNIAYAVGALCFLNKVSNSACSVLTRKGVVVLLSCHACIMMYVIVIITASVPMPYMILFHFIVLVPRDISVRIPSAGTRTGVLVQYGPKPSMLLPRHTAGQNSLFCQMHHSQSCKNVRRHLDHFRPPKTAIERWLEYMPNELPHAGQVRTRNASVLIQACSHIRSCVYHAQAQARGTLYRSRRSMPCAPWNQCWESCRTK